MAGCIYEWVKLLAPSVTTVVIGSLFIQRFFAHRANQASFVDHIIKELGELRDDSLKYWSTTKNTTNSDEMKQLEGRIRGRTQSLISDISYFREHHTSWSQRALNFIRTEFPGFFEDSEDNAPNYITAMINVYEACTGEDFETDQHQADTSTYLAICLSISKTKSELMRVKI